MGNGLLYHHVLFSAFRGDLIAFSVHNPENLMFGIHLEPKKGRQALFLLKTQLLS